MNRVLLLLLSLLPLQLSAVGNRYCDNRFVEVDTDQPALHQTVCDAATRTLAFFTDYGVWLNRQVRIEVVEQTLRNRSYSAYGSYDSRSDRVRVMSPAAIQQTVEQPRMYGQPLDEAHYLGVVAHEVAHALMDQNSRVLPLPIGAAAQEYLANVAQLAVLPEAHRQRVIAAAGVGPWESGDVISNVYMAMAPDRFAVKSYLHFIQLPDRAAFIQKLLGSKWFYINVE